MKGFGSEKLQHRTAKYWVSCYKRDDEDEPISVHRAEINYMPGQSKQQKMLEYCHDLFRYGPNVWEVLVHQGPTDSPESGDQVVARMSREWFSECQELHV